MERGKVPAFFANLPPWSVGLEASGGAHHRARELQALGHDARLMPPQYVKAYTKTNKHDAADAEECCEAVQPAGHAPRAGQERGPAGDVYAAPGARPAGRPAHGDDQSAARASHRAWWSWRAAPRPACASC